MKVAIFILSVIVVVFGTVDLCAQTQNAKAFEKRALSDLKAEFGERIAIRTSSATGKVDFIRLTADSPGGLAGRAPVSSARETATAFLKTRGQIFGLREPEAELVGGALVTDDLGYTHITYTQNYRGVPVFGGKLGLHFDASGDLRAANGNFVPYIDVDTVPTFSRENAAVAAVSDVSTRNPNTYGIRAISTDLFIYRTGLAQGVSGENHLVWQIEVGNQYGVREFVFVDAHSGAVIDRFSGRYDALDRRLYDGNGIFVIPPSSYPSNPFWQEGSAFPTGNPGADEIIAASGDTYHFYKQGFGRDSYDDRGGPMVSFFNFGFLGNAWASPAANPPFTAYGDDLITDDVVAHELTHVYTYFTDNLIYAWQPGALNEAYSDIFGETIDQLNGRGLDSPGGRRSGAGNSCSVYWPLIPVVRVNSPSAIAGEYEAAFNQFGAGAPPVPAAGFTGDVVQIDDGVGNRTDGCSTPYANAADVNGKIALIEVTDDCYAVTKVKNAELNGAVAVILANNSVYGDNPVPFSGDGTATSIPSVNIGKATGDLIRSQLAAGVNVTVSNSVDRNSDNTYRWLLGEDLAMQGFRDMWNPNCAFNPGRSTDGKYFCGGGDNGGVHSNSGIPNHTFALLVDGGTYNGQRIRGIGLTKAAHIYFRAMTVYQVPFTDFADHAEALEASAVDLLGRDLADLRTGLPSGERITGPDLQQLHAATIATELRDPPTQCNFRPVLGKNPPDDSCGLPGTRQVTIFSDTFEGNPFTRWTAGREVASDTTFQGGNWSWVHNLPDGRRGSGFFAYDFEAGCDLPYPGQNGVLELASPIIKIPSGLAGGPHLSFDHWVATEEGYDGGQLMISVNGGPFQLVDPSAFVYNSYNSALLPFPYSDNTRGGEPAFTGTDGGSIKGSWGTSIVDLSGYAQGGDTVRLRFDMSTDFCFGTGQGWFLDNVRVYACGRTGRN